jgi:diguanylate cyclase (GGDEF)-like protein
MSVALHNSAKTGTGSHSIRNRAPADQLTDSVEMSCALDASQRQFAATLQTKVDLLRHCSLLAEKVSSLEIALSKAHQLALYDELTGLPNRRLLLDRFIQAAALANRHGELFALLFFDVNNFKGVNDKLGHVAGDQLLQQVATRLSSSMRRSDTACRYGGDEFIVLLTEISSHEQAFNALKKIRVKLAPSYAIGSSSIRLTVSDGLAIYPRHARCLTDLMEFADRSMYSNKSAHRCQPGGMPASEIWLHNARNGSSHATNTLF